MLTSFQLQTQVYQVLTDHQAEQISVLDVHAKTTITDYMIIGTARSTRHLNALSEQVVRAHKKFKPTVQGRNDPNWIIIDLRDVVVHLMLSEARDIYHLEALWS
jgi:ribosome-associated protein